MRKVITIDCDYVYPEFAAAYLVRDQGEAYFVETNTQYAVPRMLKALVAEGLSPEQVRYIFITHVHLDHAGGAAKLIEACPNAVLVAHPRAARHAIDPSKLEASARKVYGDEAFDQLYGKLNPISENRVQSVGDGEILEFGASELKIMHTRGHANHHFSLYDPSLSAVFTGDAFGLSYPALQSHGLFIFPSTSPTDFDAHEAKASIRRILDTGAEKVFLTHFGELTRLAEAAEQLNEYLEYSERILNEATDSKLSGQALANECEKKLRRFLAASLERKEISLTPENWELIRMDIELNAAGVAWVAEKKRMPQS